jgi:catechol 2,3-dioxygenase-like lactoylglutathione lyase family enzyme
VAIDHVKLPVTDLDASRTFYSAALEPLGYRLILEADNVLAYGARPLDEEEPFTLQLGPAPNVRMHVAFTATSTEQVDEFHAAALAAGGRDNGPPGDRPYGRPYYAAFVLDPDGHNIEAVFHEPRL